MFVLTHDENLKEVNYEGIGSFQSVLKHWKSDYTMSDPKLCWKCAYGTISDAYYCNESLKKSMLDLVLSFNDTRQVTDTSCINACVNLGTNKVISHCNRIAENSFGRN